MHQTGKWIIQPLSTRVLGFKQGERREQQEPSSFRKVRHNNSRSLQKISLKTWISLLTPMGTSRSRRGTNRIFSQLRWWCPWLVLGLLIWLRITLRTQSHRKTQLTFYRSHVRVWTYSNIRRLTKLLILKITWDNRNHCLPNNNNNVPPGIMRRFMWQRWLQIQCWHFNRRSKGCKLTNYSYTHTTLTLRRLIQPCLVARLRIWWRKPSQSPLSMKYSVR